MCPAPVTAGEHRANAALATVRHSPYAVVKPERVELQLSVGCSEVNVPRPETDPGEAASRQRPLVGARSPFLRRGRMPTGVAGIPLQQRSALDTIRARRFAQVAKQFVNLLVGGA
jgi:hypothetical protein